jgi:hypothetical protein
MNKSFYIGLASIALLASSSAYAQATGSIGGGTGTFLHLTDAGLGTTAGGTEVATLSGGDVLFADQPFADIPAGGVYENAFLAAGPGPTGQPATLTFAGAGVSYLSFLWGSPDYYNDLTINTTSGSSVFTAALLGLPTDGNQSFSSYVQFTPIAGQLITSIVFNNIPSIDAFETANYSIDAGVPEPGTWAMMLLGFGFVGTALRRRRRTRVLPQIA